MHDIDPVPRRLREAEQEIDTAYRDNPLTNYPFSRAAWYFLAQCEEIHMREIMQADLGAIELTRGRGGAVADNVMIHAKWGLHWLAEACEEGTTIPTAYDEDAYQAALDLSAMASNYLSFETAYTWASLGIITLAANDHLILPSDELHEGARYDAYDRLVTAGQVNPFEGNIDTLLATIEGRLRIEDDLFSYHLDPGIVNRARSSINMRLSPHLALPDTWMFPRYTMEDFRRFAEVLSVLCLIHWLARIRAAQLGCRGLGYANSILIMDRRELQRRMERYTGLDRELVEALIEDLTYGQRGIRNPDPALQPLIPLTADTIALPPNLIINNSLQRNLIVLFNRLPEERDVYARLSQEREMLSRQWIREALVSYNLRLWDGSVGDWQESPDIDLALVDDTACCALILELKSFVAPAEAREVEHRSEEIARGIAQIQTLQSSYRNDAPSLHEALEIDADYAVHWAVASESSVGGAHVQEPNVPVLRTRHLIWKILDEGSLERVCQWMDNRSYLPVEGIHYRQVTTTQEVGGWSLEWYGIETLNEEDFQQSSL